VGIGDALGEFDRANLNRVIRADGVIVKPDDAITPLDTTYIEQATDRRLSIVATAHTRHSKSLTSYVFAYAQPSGQPTARLSPSALGHKGPVYAYNYFDGYGIYLQQEEAVEFFIPDDGAYWIVVPVGPSGVGFLGDIGKFVSNGRNRVARIVDNGSITVRVVFSAGESRLRFFGFSLSQPQVRAAEATIVDLAYDPQTRLFYFDLIARPGTSPAVTMRAAANPKTTLAQ
jgi:hypothetical protein